MKKLFLAACFILALGATLLAQDCATGYCPATITVHHKAGTISPVTANITYGVTTTSASGTKQCWITRNLGATTAPTNYNDVTYTANGWYWEFNRKQGFSMTSGGVITPAASNWVSSINETSNWITANDPCTLLLGTGWRLPTYTEWNNVLTTYSTPASAFSLLSLTQSGAITSNGWIYTPGTNVNGGPYGMGGHWSSTSASATGAYTGWLMWANGSGVGVGENPKTWAVPVTCLRTF